MASTYVYLLITFIVLLRLAKEKEIRPSRMWIVPALFALVTLSSLASSPAPTTSVVLLWALCLAIGIGTGIWRGRIEKVRVHPTTGRITSQSPFLGIALFAGAVLLRLAAEYWGEAHALVSLSSALLFVPLGSICARRCILYVRYRRMPGKSR